MGNKAEQLRAMREASAKAEKVSAKDKIAEGLREALSVARGEATPARLYKHSSRSFSEGGWGTKSKNGIGKRFVPNRTKGRPHGGKAHLTNEARKPWEAMKISRRTWYRRLAKRT